MYDRLVDYSVDGKITASDVIRGKQAGRPGDAVMLGDDGLIPKRFLREEKFTVGMAYDEDIFETDDEGCLTYSADATGMIPVSNNNNNLDIGSFNFDSNLLYRDWFYATLDEDSDIISILNPYNLNKSIDGKDTSVEIQNNNTMICIPTLYSKGWDKGITYSNDPDKGTPYAHTIDGHTSMYRAYGVYESSLKDGKLMSVSGVYPARNITRTDFRTYAQANGAGWGLTNWYDRQLINHLMGIFPIKRFNSQDGLGNGFTSGGNSSTNPEGSLTGSLNTAGVFAGDTLVSTNPVKSIIENPWGSKWEFIDDFVVDKGYTVNDEHFIDIYAGQNSQPDDLLTSKTKIATVQVNQIESSYSMFCTKINTGDNVWGLFDNHAGSATTGLCDRHWVNGSAQRLGVAGGGSYVGGVGAGVSALGLYGALSGSVWLLGCRLAFSFDM